MTHITVGTDTESGLESGQGPGSQPQCHHRVSGTLLQAPNPASHSSRSPATATGHWMASLAPLLPRPRRLGSRCTQMESLPVPGASGSECLWPAAQGARRVSFQPLLLLQRESACSEARVSPSRRMFTPGRLATCRVLQNGTTKSEPEVNISRQQREDSCCH